MNRVLLGVALCLALSVAHAHAQPSLDTNRYWWPERTADLCQAYNQVVQQCFYQRSYAAVCKRLKQNGVNTPEHGAMNLARYTLKTVGYLPSDIDREAPALAEWIVERCPTWR